MTASHLLVGFDFSEACYTAFWHAVGLAGRLDHRLTLLHVDVGGTARRSFLGRRRRQMLDELAEAARRHGVDVDVRLRTGAVAETIEGVRVDEGVDLVVLGRREARGWPRRRRGDRLGAVLTRRLDVPVLVVPGTAAVECTRGHGPPPYRHLLVASSLRAEDDGLLEGALRLRDQLDARLTLVDTSRRTPPRQRGSSPRYTGREQALERLSRRLRDGLREVLNRRGDDGQPTAQVVHSGLRRGVLRIAEALDVDLLVLGPTQGSMWQRLRVGAASLEVGLRRAPMPVLSVPVGSPGGVGVVAGGARVVR